MKKGKDLLLMAIKRVFNDYDDLYGIGVLPRERKYIDKTIGDDALSLRDLAKKDGITKQRVGQVRKRGVEKLLKQDKLAEDIAGKVRSYLYTEDEVKEAFLEMMGEGVEGKAKWVDYRDYLIR